MTTLTQCSFSKWQDYLELTKPRVVLLMLLTAIVGMHLASPTWIPFSILFNATIGIGLVAASAAALNHVVDRHIDILMARTQGRPIAQGKIEPREALIFAAVIGSVGTVILWFFVNPLTAVLSLLTLIGYAGVYTLYLKRATPQNIVIGGAAGACPPLLGWVAVTGHVDPYSLLLVLIIFVWTPPHFWALAIHRFEEYRSAKIPMLPVTHGIPFTKLSILLYTILLILVSLLPFLTGMSSAGYAFAALILGLRFLDLAIKLWRSDNAALPMKTFYYSIYYLFLLFIALLIDHYFLMSS